MYGGEMSKETENRLKTELDKLDELSAKGAPAWRIHKRPRERSKEECIS